MILIIAIMLFAGSNAILAATRQREPLRWSTAAYWMLVLIYWMCRTMEERWI